MEKIIEIDLNNRNDLVSKYNEEKLDNELLEYIIKQAMPVKKNEKLKVIINKRCYMKEDCLKLIREGLKEEYNRSIKERDENNMKQFVFLIIGCLFIFLSTLIEKRGLGKEILLITGSVPLWEMIELELFPDVYGRRKRKVIKKLLNSHMIERL